MIEDLKSRDIKDVNVLNAMLEVPRHFFFDSSFLQFAYEDNAFPIGFDQTISHPYTVAFQSELLNAKPGCKVLEIGTGSGYQAAVLSLLDADVFTIERQKKLYNKTKEFLPKIGYRCEFIFGDGYKGLPNFAPFDKIIVTCGAPKIPEELLTQLKVGGRMVVPIGDGKNQKMHLIQKKSSQDYDISTHGNFLFVPMLDDKNSL